MMNTDVQIITTPEGHELAVLPREDFERLVAVYEDAQDVAAFDAAMEADEESFPAAFVEELLTTDCALRSWRKYRGLSQKDLAERARTTQPMISGLEQPGAGLPSLQLARNLATALDCDVSDLFAPDADAATG